MHSIRCRCGKIVCQVANLPEPPRVEEVPKSSGGPAAVILCRHCKTYVVLEIPSISAIRFTHSVDGLQGTSDPASRD